MNANILFLIGIIVAATGILSPPLALAAGLIYGLTFWHPYQAGSKKLARVLLQSSVVALGFGMNFQQMLRAGRAGLLYSSIGILSVLAVGWLLGKMLRVRPTVAFLISAGTAICGGSAIAAVGPIVEANEEEMTISLSTVFVLNSIALLIFPPIGWSFHLSQQQFGLWPALSIHDTSSAVGATARYGAIALVVGTTIKLARAMWIVPLSFGAALVKRSSGEIRWPWFIGLFCAAVVANIYLPALTSVSHTLSNLGKLGLTATLFVIGTGISRRTLRQVGPRPLVQGVLLWTLVAGLSLWFIHAQWITF